MRSFNSFNFSWLHSRMILSARNRHLLSGGFRQQPKQPQPQPQQMNSPPLCQKINSASAAQMVLPVFLRRLSDRLPERESAGGHQKATSSGLLMEWLARHDSTHQTFRRLGGPHMAQVRVCLSVIYHCLLLSAAYIAYFAKLPILHIAYCLLRGAAYIAYFAKLPILHIAYCLLRGAGSMPSFLRILFTFAVSLLFFLSFFLSLSLSGAAKAKRFDPLLMLTPFHSNSPTPMTRHDTTRHA
jgi:hypothetical protein